MPKPVNPTPPDFRLAPILLTKGLPTQQSARSVPVFLFDVQALTNLGPPTYTENVNLFRQKIATVTFRLDSDHSAAGMLTFHEATLR